jgi:amino acid transporter
MLFFEIKNVWFRIGIFLILSAWALLFVSMMYQSYYVTEPYDPALIGTRAYGHNGAGDFKTFSVIVLIEYLSLLGVLLPFSFSRFYWIRFLVLQMVFGGWFFLLVLGAMHSGGVYMIHLLAVLAVLIIIFILLLVSVVAEIVNGNKSNFPR